MLEQGKLISPSVDSDQASALTLADLKYKYKQKSEQVIENQQKKKFLQNQQRELQ